MGNVSVGNGDNIIKEVKDAYRIGGLRGCSNIAPLRPDLEASEVTRSQQHVYHADEYKAMPTHSSLLSTACKLRMKLWPKSDTDANLPSLRNWRLLDRRQIRSKRVGSMQVQ